MSPSSLEDINESRSVKSIKEHISSADICTFIWNGKRHKQQVCEYMQLVSIIIFLFPTVGWIKVYFILWISAEYYSAPALQHK